MRKTAFFVILTIVSSLLPPPVVAQTIESGKFFSSVSRRPKRPDLEARITSLLSQMTIRKKSAR